MAKTDNQKLNHYRAYLSIYGLMMIELAKSDEEVLKLINGDDLSPYMLAIRERIEGSPFYE